MSHATLSRRTFVIMLDHHLGAWPRHWPVVFRSASIAAARAQAEFDQVLELPPRDQYTAARKEPKSLTDLSTGRQQAGAIYQLQPKGATP